MAEDVAPACSLVRAGFCGPVRILIAAAGLIGAIVLFGWAFAVEPMKRLAPGLTPMNPVAALCVELCCLALWAITDRPQGGRRRIAALLSVPVLYVGLAVLVDRTFGTSLGLDAILFPAQWDFGRSYDDRIAPNAAVCLVMLALAILVTDRAGWPRFLHPQWLVTPILCLGLAGIIGYTYDLPGFYRIEHYIPMPLHCSTCFILLGSAVILCRPEQGYLRMVPRGSPGARSYAMLLPACVLLPFLVGGIALFGTDRGWFDGRGTGTAIATVLTILGMSILAFLNSVALNVAETARRAAEIRLQALVVELDGRNADLEREVAQKERAQERAAYQATHDFLTGLPNRLLFLDRLDNAIGRALRHGDAFALFYLDVDHFKPVNDRYGHQAGDELLKALAGRLGGTIREIDTAARLGGDEFAVIMEAPVDVPDAVELAERLLAAMCQPYRLTLPGWAHPLEVEVGVSVGIALFPDHANDLDGLVRVADNAMYRAKAQDGSSNIEIAVVRQQA
jgi:diguanylate cyclase (GGDEF)-like protein